MPVRLLLCAFLFVPGLVASPQDAAALTNAGDRKFAAGDIDGSLEDYQQALAAVSAAVGVPGDKASGPDSLDAASLSLKVAKALGMKGDYRGSKTLAERALHIYESANGPESASAAMALNAIGFAVQAAGDYAGATPIFQRALAIARKTLGPEEPETLEIQEAAAFNFLRNGEFAKAKQMEEDALDICERRFGPMDVRTAHALQILSQILTEMGDYPSSSKYQLRSLAILQEKAGADAVEVGDALVTMGNAASNSAQYAHAAEYFERATAIYAKRLGPHNTRLGGALDNLGQSLTHLNRLPEARAALNRALAIQTQELGPTHPWTGNVIQSLGKLESAAGNYSKARELFEENLAIWRDRLGPAHPFTVVSMTLLSDVLAHLGQYPAALDTALDAVRIRRDHILLTVRSVDERQALKYAELHTASIDTALTIAARPASTPGERVKVWDALIQSRALVLDEMAARHRSIQQSRDPAVADLMRRLAAARSQIARLVLQGPGKLPVAEYSASVERSRVEQSQAEEALALKSAEFRRELEQRRTGFDEVRVALPAGSGLVAFRRFRRTNYSVAGDPTTASYLAFVLSGSRQDPVVVSLGDAARIDGLVKQWRAEIDREQKSLGRAAQSNEASYRVAAEALRAAVWDPVARRLGGVTRVYIVPDGSLQLVNFVALPAPGSSEGRYLVETGPLLHLLSAERDLAAPPPGPSGTELLVVADPQFQAPLVMRSSSPEPAVGQYRGTHAECGDFASLRFAGLPGSLAEMQTILRIWNTRGWVGVGLSGSAATEAAVKSAVSGKRVVHLATHGFFLDEQCPGTSVARENPLLRSGIALAGANLRQTAGPGEEDGILTAEEAASLDLEGTEWVVLSGCDTGLGDIKAGEGVLGLRRAFQEAGARTIVNSLWPVNDREAQQWMAALYRARFLEDKGTAESVRDADLRQLRDRRAAAKSTHPFYWAGFVAVGDWR
jgi:CHAT domain-containing protein